MENKYKGIQGLGSLLERYRQVKVRIPDTLFDIEPSWDKLLEHRCPICGTKLTFPLNRKVAICRGKRHGDKKSFLISTQKLAQILDKNERFKKKFKKV